ncbi:acyl-coenzyme A thioesterase PaaI-like protein [Actinoallomurus bryophytorum]|uniref:Acyl-coenzyme A thioesterase THEM4 n=1 Tax=Actinoallomurus bryophytorum TaxID=1490222 RepID=A0A543BZH2_9ACTN|nr:acyl-coenzyme A thioesterase PaaI-like protein [Actinoallomurus bryophytorum]
MLEGKAILAARIRELIELTVLVDGPESMFAEAADRVAAVVSILRAATDSEPGVPAGRGWPPGVDDALEGVGNPLAPPMIIGHPGESGADGEVAALVTLGSAHEGAPGRAHGGWVAAILDHAVGRAAAQAGSPGMTVSLTVDYHRATPYGVPLDVRSRRVDQAGRKVFASAEILTDGQVTASATATLVTVRALANKAGGERPGPGSD